MAIHRLWLAGLSVVIAGGALLVFAGRTPAPVVLQEDAAPEDATPVVTAMARQEHFRSNLQQLEKSQLVLAKLDQALLASDALLEEPAQAPVVTAWTRGDARVIQPTIPLNALVMESAAVQVPPAFELDLAPGDQVRMPLPDGTELPVTVTSNTRKPNGDLSWKGFVDGHAEDYPVVLTAGGNTTFATLTSPEGSYTLEAVNGTGWVYKNIEVDGEDSLEVDHEHEHGYPNTGPQSEQE